MSSPSALDLHWLAGVLDATATITVKRVPHRDADKPASYRAHVSMTTTNPALADCALAIAQIGVVMPLDRRSDSQSVGWRWQAEAKQAATVLRLVQPYLRLRSVQCAACLTVQALNAQRAPKTPAHMAALDAAYHEATAANALLSLRRGRHSTGDTP